MIEQTIKNYIQTNNVTHIIVGDLHWYKLQDIVNTKYKWTEGDTEFWGSEIFDILIDLKVKCEFE